MSSSQNFNIITGQVKKEYPLNSSSRRFSSQSEIKRGKQNGDYLQKLPDHIRRLGTSSDARAFNYGYVNQKPSAYKTIDPPSSNQRFINPNQKTSLINASKLTFNFINHTQNSEPVKWDNARRLAPFSKETHKGRFNAPNYSNEFAERLAKNGTDFHRKRAACTELCHIQKSYGVDKLFRKYK